jgi:hypothetical protein
MKRYIIITVMLALALGLNAQRTDTGNRGKSTTTTTRKSTVEEKKPSPVKTETRKKEASPVRTSTTTEKRQEKPARTSTPRNVETPAVENRSPETNKPRTTATSRTTEQERPRNVSEGNQQPERKAGENRNSGVGRTENGQRPAGNTREVNVDRNREYVPRTEQVYVEKRQAYRTPERPRTVRTVTHSTNYVNHPVEYRRSYFPYAEPRRVEIIWDVHMYDEYRYLYPQYDYWYYPFGYSIPTISAYDADRFVGEVARIYGKVYDVWYEGQTDEYTLYFGGPYPYQDFSVILPGKNARRYSHSPERYFTNRNIAVTGLVSLWDERPEMLIRKRSQIEVYF